MVYALVVALLMTLGADQESLRIHGMGRQASEEEAPVSETQGKTESLATSRRSPAKRNRTTQNGAETYSRGRQDGPRQNDWGSPTVSHPPRFHDLRFHIPLRI